MLLIYEEFNSHVICSIKEALVSEVHGTGSWWMCDLAIAVRWLMILTLNGIACASSIFENVRCSLMQLMKNCTRGEFVNALRKIFHIISYSCCWCCLSVFPVDLFWFCKSCVPNRLFTMYHWHHQKVLWLCNVSPTKDKIVLCWNSNRQEFLSIRSSAPNISCFSLRKSDTEFYCCRYQNRLHQNLLFLSYLADAQPDDEDDPQG